MSHASEAQECVVNLSCKSELHLRYPSGLWILPSVGFCGKGSKGSSQGEAGVEPGAHQGARQGGKPERETERKAEGEPKHTGARSTMQGKGRSTGRVGTSKTDDGDIALDFCNDNDARKRYEKLATRTRIEIKVRS